MTESNRKHLSVLIKAAAMIAAVLLVLGCSQPVFAYRAGESSAAAPTVGGVSGGAYEVTGYEMKTVVGKDHSYSVELKVTVNIPDTLRKIEFAVPSGSFRLRGVETDGLISSLRTSPEGSYIVIEDPQALTVGIHEYNIRYKILEFEDRDQERDVLYYNVLLPQWKQPIAAMEATVDFPEDFPLEDLKYYSGQFGVQDSDNRVTFEQKKSGTLLIEGQHIPENYGVTLKAELPDGYWEGALNGIWAIFAMILVMGSVVLILLIMWIIGGRDPKIKRIRQTKPVEGVSPVELGYAFNKEFSIRDLVRLILYFGMKGYLKISEYEPKRYRLYRLNDPEGEEKLIRNAYSVLFENIYRNRALDMDDIGDRLQRIESTIRDDVAAGFASEDMQAFTPLSKAFRIAGLVLFGAGVAVTNGLKYSYQYISINYAESILFGIAAALLAAALCVTVDRRESSSGEIGKTMEFITGLLIFALMAYIATDIVRDTGHLIGGVLVLILAAVAVFFIVIMRARGKGNAMLMMQFRELRRFISHPTPKELLENYLADPNYYYDMLLYALTFGAEESWAVSFLTLDVPEPEWYSDDIEGHAFSNLKEKPETVDYARDIRSFVRTIEGAYEEMQRRRRKRG